jgi:hypothetical protein
MHYCDNGRSVRVDFFKESGKWYTTEAVIWDGPYTEGLLHDIFEDVLKRHLKGRLSGMWAVCVEPYHEHACPLMLKVP